MATFPANGFEIDEDDPQVPLIAIMAAAEKLRRKDGVRGGSHDSFFNYGINSLIENLGIPMHILAETDQNLHG